MSCAWSAWIEKRAARGKWPWEYVPAPSLSGSQDYVLGQLLGGFDYRADPDWFEPLSRNRGLPEDVHPASTTHSASFDLHSWVSLGELEACDLSVPFGDPGESLADYVGYFWQEFVPQLRSLGDQDDVRLIVALG